MSQETQTGGSVGKRIATWGIFIVIIGLIIWGLVAAQQKSARQVTGSVTLPSEITADDWSTGNVNATTTLVEYADFQCPICGLFYPIVEQILKDYGTQIHFVYRHFPLLQHANAYPAAIAAEAAGRQGKFWEMEGMIYEHQSDWENLPDASAVFASYATTLGLDPTKFSADVKDSALYDKVAAHEKAAKKGGIPGTPTFFLNGKRIENPANYDAFKVILDAAIK